MQNTEAREALRDAMAAWDQLSPEQQQREIAAAARRARAASQPRWRERAAAKDLTGAVQL
jgi:hypothetical protein